MATHQTGLTDIPSWLIAVDSDVQTIERYLSSPHTAGEAVRHTPSENHDISGTRHAISNGPAGYDAFVTLNHEAVHFWHAISTPFLYYFSQDLRSICLDVLAYFKRNDCRDDVTAHFQEQFAALYDSLLSGFTPTLKFIDPQLQAAYDEWKRDDAPDHSPSPLYTLQVIEGCAVLCAYRLCDASPSHERFLRHLETRYDNDVTYTGAYHATAAMLGDAAFELFAPACYLALHNLDDPGYGLCTILQHARQLLHGGWRNIDDPLGFILNAIGVEEERCFPIAVRRTLSQQQWHPVLKPYIERIAQARDRRTSDIFARPYAHFYTNHETFYRDMLPPIIIYTKDVGKVVHTDLALRIGDEYIADAVRLTTLDGIAKALVKIKPEERLGKCHHVKCPVYQTSLCHSYVMFPADDYRKCRFPQLLKWFGLERFLPPEARRVGSM